MSIKNSQHDKPFLHSYQVWLLINYLLLACCNTVLSLSDYVCSYVVCTLLKIKLSTPNSLWYLCYKTHSRAKDVSGFHFKCEVTDHWEVSPPQDIMWKALVSLDFFVVHVIRKISSSAAGFVSCPATRSAVTLGSERGSAEWKWVRGVSVKVLRSVEVAFR